MKHAEYDLKRAYKIRFCAWGLHISIETKKCETIKSMTFSGYIGPKKMSEV